MNKKDISKHHVSGFLVILILTGISGFTQQGPLAFPGAEGFGKYTTGGRGGKVYVVTNLEDDGPGSLRNAVEAKEKRFVVFSISGTIHLNSELNFRGDLTVAGQTAPGDGICIADYPVLLKGDNIIVRYMRFRMGDKNQKAGMIDGNGGDDAFGGTHRKNIIIDHCTMSWSTDEAFTVYAGDSTTLQWNLIAEPLNYSYHFEEGDTGYEHHGYGGIWGGEHMSAHHNLFAHCNNRTPRFNGIRNKRPEFVDFRNNVIYNWGENNSYAGEGGSYNMLNNYYKPGPSTKKNARDRFLNPYKKGEEIPFGKFFIAGNCLEGFPEISAHNELGVEMHQGNAADREIALVDKEFPADPVTTQSAEAAYRLVLAHAGASLHRDTLDQRIVRDVQEGTGKLIDVQGGFPHGTEYELTRNAWPLLQYLQAPKDSDGDGMPDNWEKKMGLDVHQGNDATVVSLDPYYTNLELYVNSLVPENKRAQKTNVKN
ncbi:MAG: pectate lyase [Terrimonas sp.]|nr:pectate lyase [Terrimonas sp.]